MRSEVGAGVRIAAQCGQAFELSAGSSLRISDPLGQQVADVYAVAQSDRREIFSAGRTIEYNETIRVSTGNRLYSNRSRAMFTMVKDDVGLHDLLLTPCSSAMFEILRNAIGHRSCLSNIAQVLEPYGVPIDAIGTTFNVFMRVDVGSDGRVAVAVPTSQPGDENVLRAKMDLIVAVTACSSQASNNGVCKPIDVAVEIE